MVQNKVIRGGYSESITMLRFPLAVLVVFIHSFGPEVDMAQLHAGGLTGMAVYDYVRLFVSVVIARSAVPLFFIFSGYLLFKGVEQYDRETYVGKLRKRWLSLARPYLVWNVLIVLSPVVYWLVKHLRWIYILLLLAVYLADIRPSCYSATIVPAALYFSIGAYFSIMKQDFTEVLWRWRYLILPVAAVLIVIQTGCRRSRMC